MRTFSAIQGASRELTDAGSRAPLGLADIRHSRRWFVLAPLVLVVTTYAVFQLLIPIAGRQAASFAGFAFYWLLGGIVFPVLLVGRDGVVSLFARRSGPVNFWFVVSLMLLAVPVAFGLLFASPLIFPMASGATIASLVAYGLVNGTCEEIFWRGTFAHRFPSNRWLGMFYPAVMFSLWHLVPWLVFPPFLDVPAIAVLAVVFPIALIYHWVAWSTGSIRWTVMSHVLTNISGLGAMLVFGPW